MKESWDSQGKEQVDVCMWVEQLQERLEMVRDTVRECETKAKVKMKAMYDKKAQSREFQEGNMVLLHVPGMVGKLDDAWDGPYEIYRKVNDVNYEVIVPNRKNRKKIVHVCM